MSRYKYLKFRWERKIPPTSHTQNIKESLDALIKKAMKRLVLVEDSPGSGSVGSGDDERSVGGDERSVGGDERSVGEVNIN